MLYYVEFWHRELLACLLGLAVARDATLIRNKERAYFEAGETELMDAIDTFPADLQIRRKKESDGRIIGVTPADTRNN